MSERILVTGAAGYLGRHLIEQLQDAGVNVTGVVRSHKPCSFPAERCELTDAAAVSQMISRLRPTAIIHSAAWIVAGPATSESLIPAMASNVTATANLVSACAGASVRRFMLCSTVEVYAASPQDGVSHKESDAIAPQGLYGHTKAAAEQIANSLCGAGVDVRIFRMPGLHGPPRTTGIVSRLIDAARNGQPADVAEPETRLSLLWCSDAARCIAAGARGLLRGTDTTLNLANGDCTLGGLAEQVGQACGKPLDIRSGSNSARNRALNLERMRAALPFSMPRFEEHLLKIARTHAIA